MELAVIIYKVLYTNCLQAVNDAYKKKHIRGRSWELWECGSDCAHTHTLTRHTHTLSHNCLYTDTQSNLVLITLNKDMSRHPLFTNPPNHNASIITQTQNPRCQCNLILI